MSVAEVLNQAADIFDKTAEYLEKSESSRLAMEKKAKDEKAIKLATQIAETTGEELDETLVEKLSGIDPDIQALLGRLGHGDTVDSLGGPPEHEKVAGLDGVPPEDSQLLSWINS